MFEAIKNNKVYTMIELILVLAIGFGWILNIIDIVNSMVAPLTGLFVLRCIGIFIIPLGCVLGYS